MMDNHHLRGIILKLENRLSDDDRKRLHFFLGNNVPRRIRDDPSLGGTLSLMESLFDQDKINEQDFTFLINAFDEIRCMDAVKLLRDHMRRMQSNRLNQSIQSLASIMPPTIDQSLEAQDEDKYAMQSLLITQRTSSDNSIEMIDMNNTRISPVTELADNQSSRSNRRKHYNKSSMTYKYLSSFALLLSLIGAGVLTAAIIIRSRQFTKELQMKDKSISEKQVEYSQTLQQLNYLRSRINQTTEQLIDQLQRSLHEQTKQNKTIEQLNILRSMDNHTIQQLHTLQATNNRTKQQLIVQLQQSDNKQIKQNETIEQLNNFWIVDNQTIRQLANQSKQLMKEQAQNNQTIQQLTDQVRKSVNAQIKQNETIERLNILRSMDDKTIQQLTNQLRQSFEKSTRPNINNVTVVNNEQIVTNNIIYTESTQKPGELCYSLSQIQRNSGEMSYTSEMHRLNKSKTSIRYLHIEPSTTWSQNGFTVAGGHKDDDGFNLLIYPYGFEVDEDQTIVIADYLNHRVIEWQSGATSGQVVAGGKQRGNRYDQLNYPTNVVIDKEMDKLIICDKENWRVVRWPRRDGKGGETIISPVKCFGLTMDADRSLYVSDLEQHEVRRWRMGETQGTLVAGGNEKGNRLDQFNSPRYIFIDHDHSLFVSDSQNYRVIKWMKDTKEGVVVAGRQGEGSTLTQLFSPGGLFVDQLGSVYVADCSNYRIMRWSKGATHESVVVGENDYGNGPNQLSYPTGLSFDLDGNLYVADYDNNRIQKFDVNKIR